jgi:hypothetical protein
MATARSGYTGSVGATARKDTLGATSALEKRSRHVISLLRTGRLRSRPDPFQALATDRRCAVRILGLALVTLVFLTLAGCSDSTGPDKTEKPTYPDIAGLVAFYPFDDDLKNAVSDDHHGTASGELTYVADRDGSTRRAIHVDVSSEVIIPDHADFDIGGYITLAAWVKPDPFNRAYGAVIDKNYAEAYSFGLHGAVGPDTVCMISYIGDVNSWSSDIIPLGTETWSHIAFTYEEATGKSKYYFNGAIADSMTRGGVLGVSDADLRIGGGFTTDDYGGAIDEAAIFNRALTPAEVSQLFAFD